MSLNGVATDSLSHDSPILAAPYGVLASKPGLANSDHPLTADHALAQTPNTQMLSLGSMQDTHDSLWRHSCLKALELSGLDSSKYKAGSWVNLFVSRSAPPGTDHEMKPSQATVPWPESLCFRKRPLEVQTTCRVGDTMLSGHEECHDPLGDARGWFNATAERDEKFLKRKKDRLAAVPKDFSTHEPQSQRLNGQSPLALRRPSAAAPNVIYPTPPDALHQHLGVTPSIDGNTSSPGNQPPTAAIVDIDTAMPTATPTGELDNDEWDETTESKPERSDGNMMDDSDDMMNRMGDDVFGENDITEDDFKFFDEQPDGPQMDITMPDLQPTALPPLPQTMVIPHAAIINPEPQTAVQESIPPKAKPSLDDAVFAKPELRHARSSLNDELYPHRQVEKLTPVKRQSSPFDPSTVFKRVKASLTDPVEEPNGFQQRSRRNSIFEKVDFDPKIPMINKKYEHGGAFDFSINHGIDDSKDESGALPQSEYMERHGKLKKPLKRLPLPAGTLMKNFAGIEAPRSHPSPAKGEGNTDSEESDLDSDEDDSSYMSAGPASPVKSSVKRIPADDDQISQTTTSKEVDLTDDVFIEELAIELPRMSKPEHPDISLCRFFKDPEPLALDVALSHRDFVEIAQLITEQAATGFLKVGIDHKNESLATMRGHELSIARNSLQSLQNIIPSILGGGTPLRLKGLLDVPDIPLAGQPTRLPPRPVPGRDPNVEQLRPSNLYQIPGPHLEVRRAETRLSVLPSAVTFWESLGLAPSWGTKDINAICVFPGWKGMSGHVGTFLGCLKSVYESLKLGTFNNMVLGNDLDDGVLPYEVDRISTSPDATVTGHGSAILESMETLRVSLTEWKAKEKNLVIYFIYSPDNPASIVEACTAFYRFFDMYNEVLTSKRETPENELVLQLVSSELISSTTSLVIPNSTELSKLCMETFDRCTLFLEEEFGGPAPAPAVMLEQVPPRMIDFKLCQVPSQSLMHENSCIHVAYAQSIDDRWITAAWTDNRGQQQATASYCLSRRDKPGTVSKHLIFMEIWETTVALMSIWKVHWRVIITKCGTLDSEEVSNWQDLSQLYDPAANTIIIVAVDTSPSLQLIPPTIKIPHAATSAFYSTPVSTPQANIVSPEQTTTPATPMRDTNGPAATPGAENAAEADSDSFLIDATDQTWGAVVGHRLNNSPSPMNLRPSFVSGYLIKRTGMKLEDPPVVMEVNLAFTEAIPRAYEPLLREILSYFRNLGTLARARGIVDRETDLRPWHVAAAEKGVRALHLLL